VEGAATNPSLAFTRGQRRHGEGRERGDNLPSELSNSLHHRQNITEEGEGDEQQRVVGKEVRERGYGGDDGRGAMNLFLK
jgi:hypothetical protein